MNRGPDPAKNLLVIRPIIPGQVIPESNFQPSKLKTLQPFRIKLVSLENGIIFSYNLGKLKLSYDLRRKSIN